MHENLCIRLLETLPNIVTDMWVERQMDNHNDRQRAWL